MKIIEKQYVENMLMTLQLKLTKPLFGIENKNKKNKSQWPSG